MRFENDWAMTEQCLAREAPSLSGILSGFLSDVPTIQDPAALHRAARDIPVEVAAFPMDIVSRLDGSTDKPRLGISFLTNSEAAKTFEGRDRRGPLDRLAVRTIEAFKHPGMSFARHALGKIKLECASGDPSADDMPRLALFPATALNPSPRHYVSIAEALSTLSGLRGDIGTATEPVLAALAADHVIGCMSASFLDGIACIRLVITRFHDSDAIGRCLIKVGCPRRTRNAVLSVLRHIEGQHRFSYLGIDLHCDENGIGPRVGVSYCLDDREWIKPRARWTPLLNALSACGIGCPDMLAALDTFKAGSKSFVGRTGQRYALVRGLHHVRTTCTLDGQWDAQANLFMVVCAVPNGQVIGSRIDESSKVSL